MRYIKGHRWRELMAARRPSPEYLRDQYVVGGRTLRSLADEFATAEGTVWKWLQRDGTQTRAPGIAAVRRYAEQRATSDPSRVIRRSVRAAGYVELVLDDRHPFASMGHRAGVRRRSVVVPEHRLVVADRLGRPLLDHERVHHINGVRSDNRDENLELWSSSHPYGQRVDDKISWAIDLLRLYRPELLAGDA